MARELQNGHAGGYPGELRQRLESFREADAAREKLIQRLLNENLELYQKNQEAIDDLDTERAARRRWKHQSDDFQAQVAQLHRKSETDPFALVLIDGDGFVFLKELLQSGGDGGAEAAHRLNGEIRNTLQERGSNVNNIMVFIYADLESLSRKLSSVGLLRTAGELHAFTRSFSVSQGLFNFVDVGTGKERADHKIREMFRLFVNNSHCKHIIFGGCHDKGYLVNLEQYKRDASVASRMTLLESTNAAYGYRDLGFPIVRYESVFRSQELPDGRPRQMPFHNAQQSAAGSNFSATAHVFAPYNGTENVFTPSSAHTSPAQAPPVGLAARTTSPAPNGYPARPSPPPAQPTNAPNRNTAPSPAPSANSWATVGGSGDSKGKISIAPAKEPKARKYILYNENQERVDEKLPRPDPAAELRVKNRVAKTGKLCNAHHLFNGCPKGSSCEYIHDPPLRESERLWLRHRARSTPCKKRWDCNNMLCPLGHMCPTPDCRRNDCFFGEMHGIDEKPRMKVLDNDEVIMIGEPLEE